MTDRIILDGIEVMARVGVPDEERARPQRLEISLAMEVNLKTAGVRDDLTRSVDYEKVDRTVREVVRQRPRKLIETVAEDVARAILRSFKVRAVEVEVRKFILPNTRGVSVRIHRGKG